MSINTKKAFHIVAGKNEMKYANMLFTLVSGNESIKCSIYSNVKKYIDNQMSSDNYILFIGSNAATSKNMTAMLEMKYDEYGVKYATHGKIAQIWRESIFWNSEKMKKFSEFYDDQVKRLEKIQNKYDIEKGAWDAFYLVVAGFVGFGMKKIFEAFVKYNKVKDAQYNLGIMLFVQDELEKFMQVSIDEENSK